MTKIVTNIREKVLRLREDGLSYKQIGDRLGCSKTTASYYINPAVSERLRNRNKARKVFHPKIIKVRDYCMCGCQERVSRNNERFASSKCQAEYAYRQYIQRWMVGHETGLKGSIGHLSGHVRRYILERDNYKCVICGWGQVNPHTGTWSLVVDHINGNSEDTTDVNLRTLCPNCDSLQATHKGANRGRGRAGRRELYKLGRRVQCGLHTLEAET